MMGFEPATFCMASARDVRAWWFEGTWSEYRRVGHGDART